MYGLFNQTDGVFASPDSFKTKRAARAFARRFRERYAAQGYYLTADRQRIPVEAVELVIVPLDGDNTG